MKCVHQIFPSELWFLGLYLVLHVWHVYIRSFLLNYGFLVLSCPLCMTCVHQIFPSELWFLGPLPGSSCMTCVHQIWTMVSWSTWSFMYDMCTSDLSFWTMVSWSLPCPSCIWHVYIRSFLLNCGFLVSTWFFMYDMCTSDLSFWTMVSWSLPGPSCMTCVHQIFPSELWFLGLPGPSCMTCVHQIFPSELWFLWSTLSFMLWTWVHSDFFLLNYGFFCLPGPLCMTCVHQIFPSELWFLGLYLIPLYDMCTSDLSYGVFVYLVLHVWHVYIRSFLLNYVFLVSTWSFMYDMCTSDLSFCTYGFLVSTWSCMYDMCTSDLSFWTMVSWSLLAPSCIWHVYIRSFLLNYGFLVYLVLYVWHVYIRSFLLIYGFLVYWFFMYKISVHQIFPSELWFLGLYLVLHVWHVYIRSLLLNYGFLVSTWSIMYDMCTSDFSF